MNHKKTVIFLLIMGFVVILLPACSTIPCGPEFEYYRFHGIYETCNG